MSGINYINKVFKEFSDNALDRPWDAIVKEPKSMTELIIVVLMIVDLVCLHICTYFDVNSLAKALVLFLALLIIAGLIVVKFMRYTTSLDDLYMKRFQVLGQILHKYNLKGNEEILISAYEVKKQEESQTKHIALECIGIIVTVVISLLVFLMGITPIDGVDGGSLNGSITDVAYGVIILASVCSMAILIPVTVSNNKVYQYDCIITILRNIIIERQRGEVKKAQANNVGKIFSKFKEACVTGMFRSMK